MRRVMVLPGLSRLDELLLRYENIVAESTKRTPNLGQGTEEGLTSFRAPSSPVLSCLSMGTLPTHTLNTNKLRPQNISLDILSRAGSVCGSPMPQTRDSVLFYIESGGYAIEPLAPNSVQSSPGGFKQDPSDREGFKPAVDWLEAYTRQGKSPDELGRTKAELAKKQSSTQKPLHLSSLPFDHVCKEQGFWRLGMWPQDKDPYIQDYGLTMFVENYAPEQTVNPSTMSLERADAILADLHNYLIHDLMLGDLGSTRQIGGSLPEEPQPAAQSLVSCSLLSSPSGTTQGTRQGHITSAEQYSYEKFDTRDMPSHDTEMHWEGMSATSVSDISDFMDSIQGDSIQEFEQDINNLYNRYDLVTPTRYGGVMQAGTVDVTELAAEQPKLEQQLSSYMEDAMVGEAM